MTEELKQRLGRDTERGREWPALDLLGNKYTKPPAATMGVGGGYFVVLPGSVKPAQYADVLEQVKALVPKTVKSAKSKEAETE